MCYRFVSSETGNSRSFEPLPSQRLCSYKVRFEDIGRCLRCECIITDVFGRSSEPTYAETDSVLPGNMQNHPFNLFLLILKRNGLKRSNYHNMPIC